MNKQQPQRSNRWVRQTPRVPATRRGVEPKTPAYIPARRKPTAQS